MSRTAERRMFAKTVIDSDAFLDMPMSAQCLYFHLGMRADDDGFLNNPKKIQRMVGASDDDFRLLIMKRFVIVFDNGVMVIKHWRLHNYIQKDRYKPTVYQDELAMLTVKENGVYTECIQDGYTGKVSIELGKDSIGKDSIGEGSDVGCASTPQSKRFTPPTREEVQQYITEHGYHVDAERFTDYYTSNGWMVGKNKMKDWKAAVRTWERKEKESENATSNIFQQIAEERKAHGY